MYSSGFSSTSVLVGLGRARRCDLFLCYPLTKTNRPSFVSVLTGIKKLTCSFVASVAAEDQLPATHKVSGHVESDYEE